MIKNVARYKIVMDDNGLIYAVVVYRYFTEKNSYKCILIGHNKHLNSDDTKIAAQWIIKSDIINWKKLYWIKASDPVAH